MRLSAIWYIWLARNAPTIPPMKPETTQVTKVKIWHQVKTILTRSEWGKCRIRGEVSSQVEERGKYIFQFDFGCSGKIYNIDKHNQIHLCKIPPEPD